MKKSMLLFALSTLSAFAVQADFTYVCNLGNYSDELDVIVVSVTDSGEVIAEVKTDIADVGSSDDCKNIADLKNSK